MNKEILEMAFSHYGPKEMAEFLAACKESETTANAKEAAAPKTVAAVSHDTEIMTGPEAARYLLVSENSICTMLYKGLLKNENPITGKQPGGHYAKYSRQQLDWLRKSAPKYFVKARQNYQKGLDAEPAGYLTAEHACVVFGISDTTLNRLVRDNSGLVHIVSKSHRGGYPRNFYSQFDLERLINRATSID